MVGSGWMFLDRKRAGSRNRPGLAADPARESRSLEIEPVRGRALPGGPEWRTSRAFASPAPDSVYAPQGGPLRVALELQAGFHTENLMSANLLAEIPGTDLAGEVVMLGAHLDSWHSGTGATDNPAGCAVAMEAVRILRALDLKPRRTIRVALWSGEEQGLLGSKAYVAEHFGSASTPPSSATAARGNPAPSTMARGLGGKVEKKPDYGALSGYFNLSRRAGGEIGCRGHAAYSAKTGGGSGRSKTVTQSKSDYRWTGRPISMICAGGMR
jgi:hypothetical protein